MRNSDHQPIETLRLSDRERSRLLQSVELNSSKSCQEDRRRLRVQYTQSKAVLSLFSEVGAVTKFVVMPRNLSRLGVAFVHGRFVFSQMRCEMLLQSLDGAWHAIPGKVANCRHVQGMVHEIAVVFDEPIDLPAFVALSPEQEMLNSEDVTRDMTPEEAAMIRRMAGRVLVVDSFKTDLKLFTLWLSRAGFQVESVTSVDDAREKAGEERFDLVVVDVAAGDAEVLELIGGLTRGLSGTTVLAMSANDADGVREAAMHKGAGAFLAKPFTEEQLRGQAQAMVGLDLDEETDQTPIFSTSAEDEELKPLLAEFVRGLSNHVSRLREAAARNDRHYIETLSRTLKGAGAGYGLAPISVTAAKVLDMLGDEEEVDLVTLKTRVNELVQVLNRVKL